MSVIQPFEFTKSKALDEAKEIGKWPDSEHLNVHSRPIYHFFIRIEPSRMQ